MPAFSNKKVQYKKLQNHIVSFKTDLIQNITANIYRMVIGNFIGNLLSTYKVLNIAGCSKWQMITLTFFLPLTNNYPHFFFAIAKITGKGRILWFLRLKSDFKRQLVSKFDLGLLNAYKPMYFDRNIIENKELFVYCTNRRNLL